MSHKVVADFPKYMNKGSKGPHVSILHAFLCGTGHMKKEVVFDGEYGNVTSEAVNALQAELGIDGERLDGNFTLGTRRLVKGLLNFDFEGICRTVPGTTEFMQPNGDVHVWTSPAAMPRPKIDPEVEKKIFEDAQRRY